MHIVIAGGHGRVALKLTRLLAARGHRISGIIRRPGQSGTLRAAGSQPLLLDLATATTRQLAAALTGADAVVFAAGIGRGGSTRAHPVDRDAPRTVADAAELAGVRRYLMLSALGADPAMEYPADPEVQAFMRGKGEVDNDLASRSTLDCTILRPSYFRDGPGTGLIRLADRTGQGQVDRADVAAVLAALVAAPATAGRTLELISGTTPIDEAVAAACRRSPPKPSTPRRERVRRDEGSEAGGRKPADRAHPRDLGCGEGARGTSNCPDKTNERHLRPLRRQRDARQARKPSAALQPGACRASVRRATDPTSSREAGSDRRNFPPRLSPGV